MFRVAIYSLCLSILLVPVAFGQVVVTSRPVVTYYSPAASPVVTYYSPGYASAPVVYDAPVTVSRPVTTYYSPVIEAAPVTTYYAPATTYAVSTSTYYSPISAYSPVTTYYSPSAAYSPLTSYYAPSYPSYYSSAVGTSIYGSPVTVGRSAYGTLRPYVPGQPIRNALRFSLP